MKNIYRIRRRDRHNWTIERWQKGGEIISRGKFAGQVTREGWDEINPIGYYSKIRHAAVSLLDKLVGEEWPAEGWTGQDISAAFDAAERRVLEIVASIEETDTPAAGAAVLDITPEQAETIRNAADPVRAYLKVTGGKRFKRSSDETRRKLEPKAAVLERVESIR